jgi:pimeloyl-ACP methyl ester carboxylesterase
MTQIKDLSLRAVQSTTVSLVWRAIDGYRARVKRFLLIVLRCAALIYFGTVALFAGFQRQLIYFPSRPFGTEEKMSQIAASIGFEPWRDAQGQRIGWRKVPPNGTAPKNRMIVFHGNAGCAFDRTQYAKGFGYLDQGQTWQTYLFEYPGYGSRPGTPSQEAFCAAGRAALEQLAREDTRPIYLTGESLGTGLACALAGEMPQKVAGLFLMTPFAALGDVASHHYPWLPVGLILRDRWESAAALRHYHGPVAVMIAGEDEIVTAAQGQKLYDSYTGPKKRWIDPDATHNTVANTESMPWWREVSDFLIENSGPRLSPR